jgi:hypothetical protein
VPWSDEGVFFDAIIACDRVRELAAVVNLINRGGS